MKIPTIKGIIDRRILINYTVNPDIIQRILPSLFALKFIGTRQLLEFA